MDIVLGTHKKQEVEIAEISLRKLVEYLLAKEVVLKVLDASETTFETLSAAPGAERLITVELGVMWLVGR